MNTSRSITMCLAAVMKALAGFKALAAAVMLCGVALTFGFHNSVQAQVQKSGKATFQVVEQENLAIQKFADTYYIASGTQRGVYHNSAGEGFAHNLGYECSVFFDIPDLPKGVVAAELQACILRDRDGDAIFTKTSCSLSSWDDWCGGKVVSGTGKYAGISGTIRTKRFVGGANSYRRSCIASPKPEECKAFYGSGAQVTVGTTYALEGLGTQLEEWEWKIP